MNSETEPKSHEIFKKHFLVTSGTPVIVNSAFLVQAHFSQRELEHGSSAKLSIFAPGKLEIQRSTAVVKEKKSFKIIPAEEITHLIVQLREPGEEIEIGIFRLVLNQKGHDYFSFECHSTEPIDVKKFDGNIYDKDVLQDLLKPPDSYILASATKGDIKRRRKFEIIAGSPACIAMPARSRYNVSGGRSIAGRSNGRTTDSELTT